MKSDSMAERAATNSVYEFQETLFGHPFMQLKTTLVFTRLISQGVVVRLRSCDIQELNQIFNFKRVKVSKS